MFQPKYLILGIALIVLHAGAAEEIVVTGTRRPVPLHRAGLSTTVWTKDQIQQSQSPSVAHILRESTGLDVVTSGPTGGNTSLFLRGGESSHALVVIDGVIMNDPSTPANAFNFSHLPLNEIEKIEIIRGTQSVLYGGQALSGVVYITTRAAKERSRLEARAEAGSYYTFRESAHASGRYDDISYSLDVGRTDTSGFSAANEKNGNTESDSFRASNANGKIAYDWAHARATYFFRYSQSKAELDDFVGATLADDLDETLKERQALLGLKAEWRLLQGRLEPHLQFSYANNRRENNDPTEPKDTVNEGQSFQLTAQSQYQLYPHFRLTGGVDTRFETSTSENNIGANQPNRQGTGVIGVFLANDLTLLDQLFLDFGARFEHHPLFHTTDSFRVGLTGNPFWKNFTHYGSFGKGNKYPSLEQLFGASGNRGLNPEKVYDMQIGTSWTRDSFSMRLNYFYNYYFNLHSTRLISTAPTTYQWINEGETVSHGLEWEGTCNLGAWTPKTMFTYNQARSIGSNRQLPRRPVVSGGAGVSWSGVRDLTLSLRLRAVGERNDSSFTTDTLDAYALADLRADYSWRSWIQMHARIENILNASYEEAKGYGTPRLAAYAGLTLKL